MFKNSWEKSQEFHNLPTHIVEDMVAHVYPTKCLLSQEFISGGCANLNIKIYLAGNKNPYILRVYLRDKDAAFREQKLCALLKGSIPVPLINNVTNYGGYRFVIEEFIPGITLRDLFLSNEPHSVGNIMFDVGLILSKITVHEFPYSGFFDAELNIISKKPDENYSDFAQECLKSQMVLKYLDSNVILKISLLLDHLVNFLPSGNEKNLVHGDFDPANILVDKINGDWKITGVLDWEFAFSGSVLCDVANMLRYAHQMSPAFKDEFIHGLKSGGINLPENWRITCDLLNLIYLLDCLSRSDPKNSVNRCIDICALLRHRIDDLEQKYS